jgi:DNA polymerase-3 subunit gamma/tau
MPSRDELVEAWGDHVLGRLRPKAKALFQAGRFVSVEGEQAKFGLPNETHRKRCEEVRADVEAVLSEHFGRRVSLVLVVDDSSGAQTTSTGRPGPGGPDSFAPSSGSSGPSEPSPSMPAASPSVSSPSGAPASRPGAGAAAAASGSRPPSASFDRSASSASSASSDRSAPAQDDDEQDFSAFDESELGEVADVDNSPAARVLQAFPGAEEVN